MDTTPGLKPQDRRAIAEAVQRYVNLRVFREMSRIIEEWKEEERSRQRAATLLVWLAAAGAVAVFLTVTLLGRV